MLNPHWEGRTMAAEYAPMLSILIAVVLSFAIGVEREYFAKAAGMRTYTLVGLGSALFTVVSEYGFVEGVGGATSVADGSRVAAQIVTGIGFLGAGVIFVKRDAVRGLTTAASIWFVAAVGMAAGAGLYLIAAGVTVVYLLVMIGIRPLSARMPHAQSALSTYAITYEDGQGALRRIMETISNHGVKVADLHVVGQSELDGVRLQEVSVEVHGPGSSISHLTEDLSGVPGVTRVTNARFEQP